MKLFVFIFITFGVTASYGNDVPAMSDFKTDVREQESEHFEQLRQLLLSPYVRASLSTSEGIATIRFLVSRRGEGFFGAISVGPRRIRHSFPSDYIDQLRERFTAPLDRFEQAMLQGVVDALRELREAGLAGQRNYKRMASNLFSPLQLQILAQQYLACEEVLLESGPRVKAAGQSLQEQRESGRPDSESI